MTHVAKYVLILNLLLPFAPAVLAEDTEMLEEPPAELVFSQQALDQMLAPIALYPDSLLAQILMAATYPLEIVQAARWSQANPGLSGEQAVQAVEDRDWDPSVKALVAFPQILARMNEKLEWTRDLGDAFLAQQTQVMETVQNLRQKAYAAGNLRSSEHYVVEHRADHIVIEPARPNVVYLAYYDPFVVYGPWWWPAYPVYWAPWPGYHWRPIHSGFYTSVAIVIGPRFFFSRCDWPRRHINVVAVRHTVFHKQLPVATKVWHHDPHHRKSVAYRQPAVQKQFMNARPAAEVRRDTHHRPVAEKHPRWQLRADTRPSGVVRGPQPRHAPPPTFGSAAPREDVTPHGAVKNPPPSARPGETARRPLAQHAPPPQVGAAAPRKDSGFWGNAKRPAAAAAATQSPSAAPQRDGAYAVVPPPKGREHRIPPAQAVRPHAPTAGSMQGRVTMPAVPRQAPSVAAHPSPAPRAEVRHGVPMRAAPAANAHAPTFERGMPEIRSSHAAVSNRSFAPHAGGGRGFNQMGR